MEIIRGTTPTIRTRLDIDPDRISAAFITFTQAGRKIAEKTRDDMTIDRDPDGAAVAVITLDQDETIRFSDRYPAAMQFRAVMLDGSAVASEIVRFEIAPILKNEVIQ